MAIQANIKSNKYCAFCRYWSDLDNSAISPINPRAGLWAVDETVEKYCNQLNQTKLARLTCGKFSPKPL